MLSLADGIGWHAPLAADTTEEPGSVVVVPGSELERDTIALAKRHRSLARTGGKAAQVSLTVYGIGITGMVLAGILLPPDDVDNVLSTGMIFVDVAFGVSTVGVGTLIVSGILLHRDLHALGLDTPSYARWIAPGFLAALGTGTFIAFLVTDATDGQSVPVLFTPIGTILSIAASASMGTALQVADGRLNTLPRIPKAGVAPLPGGGAIFEVGGTW